MHPALGNSKSYKINENSDPEPIILDKVNVLDLLRLWINLVTIFKLIPITSFFPILIVLVDIYLSWFEV